MRKSAFFLVATILLGFSITLSAQKYSIGLKGGFSIPNLTGAGTTTPLSAGYASRIGPDFGLYGEYHYSKKISVSLGLEYSSQGGQKDKIQAFVPLGPLQAIAEMYGLSYLYADFKSVAKMNIF